MILKIIDKIVIKIITVPRSIAGFADHIAEKETILNLLLAMMVLTIMLILFFPPIVYYHARKTYSELIKQDWDGVYRYTTDNWVSFTRYYPKEIHCWTKEGF